MVAYLSGVIVVENVFGFPGIGQLLVSAVAGGDTPTVEAVAVILAATFIGISLLVDLTSLYFNPRLRSAT
jgi:peptide/nickel transport system permease protein